MAQILHITELIETTSEIETNTLTGYREVIKCQLKGKITLGRCLKGWQCSV